MGIHKMRAASRLSPVDIVLFHIHVLICLVKFRITIQNA